RIVRNLLACIGRARVCRSGASTTEPRPWSVRAFGRDDWDAVRYDLPLTDILHRALRGYSSIVRLRSRRELAEHATQGGVDISQRRGVPEGAGRLQRVQFCANTLSLDKRSRR